jgi:tRNA/tmRNA/rRNA uracil-C5-methylase (TrmA/RlmC/RlmD family)
VETDIVEEEFLLSDGRTIKYKQSAEGFSNPNAWVNVKCLDWLCDVVSKITTNARNLAITDDQEPIKAVAAVAAAAVVVADELSERTAAATAVTGKSDNDLLELYCGMGNHTMALASKCCAVTTTHQYTTASLLFTSTRLHHYYSPVYDCITTTHQYTTASLVYDCRKP